LHAIYESHDWIMTNEIDA